LTLSEAIVAGGTDGRELTPTRAWGWCRSVAGSLLAPAGPPGSVGRGWAAYDGLSG